MIVRHLERGIAPSRPALSRHAATGIGIGWLALAALTAAGAAQGQQLEPRVYSNTPVDMNFLIAGYAYSTGGLSTNPALKITNAQLKVETPIVAYARARRMGQVGQVRCHSQPLFPLLPPVKDL